MNIVLIIGCARSGTSILGELIGSHPEVSYIFEAHEVWESADTWSFDSHRLVAEDATPEVKKRIREWFLKRQGSARVIVEKNPRNILRVPFITAVFPEAKIIHIIRDGRDVSCSLMPGIGGDEWRHLKPPGWRKLFSEHAGVVRCALAWKEVIETAFEDLANVSHLQVRYEQLATRPREVARNILGYIGLTDHPDVDKFCHRIQDSTQGSYHAQRQGRWYRDDHKSRIARWRENLTVGQQREVNAILHGVLSQLGYESL